MKLLHRDIEKDNAGWVCGRVAAANASLLKKHAERACVSKCNFRFFARLDSSTRAWINRGLFGCLCSNINTIQGVYTKFPPDLLCVIKICLDLEKDKHDQKVWMGIFFFNLKKKRLSVTVDYLLCGFLLSPKPWADSWDQQLVKGWLTVLPFQAGDPGARGGRGHVAHLQPAASWRQPQSLHHQVVSQGHSFNIRMLLHGLAHFFFTFPPLNM